MPSLVVLVWLRRVLESDDSCHLGHDTFTVLSATLPAMPQVSGTVG